MAAGSDVIFTDDVSLQVFFEHLQRLAVQSWGQMVEETDNLWILYFGLGNSPMMCVSCIMLLHSVIFPFFPLFLTKRRSEPACIEE